MIQVDALTKYFGPILAVADVSFTVETGEIVGLLGNNGAGKTTIMRMLTTFLPASSGIAKVNGFDVMTESMEVRRRIGPQETEEFFTGCVKHASHTGEFDRSGQLLRPFYGERTLQAQGLRSLGSSRPRDHSPWACAVLTLNP